MTWNPFAKRRRPDIPDLEPEIDYSQEAWEKMLTDLQTARKSGGYHMWINGIEQIQDMALCLQVSEDRLCNEFGSDRGTQSEHNAHSNVSYQCDKLLEPLNRALEFAHAFPKPSGMSPSDFEQLLLYRQRDHDQIVCMAIDLIDAITIAEIYRSTSV